MKLKLIVAIGLVCLSLLSSLLLSKTVQVECQLITPTNTQHCPDQLTAELKNQLQRSSLILTNIKQQLAVSSSLFGQYLIVDLKKIWPNQVKIQLKPDEVSYQLLLGQQAYILSQSGVARPQPTLDQNLTTVDANALQLNLQPDYLKGIHPKIKTLLDYLTTEQLQVKTITLEPLQLAKITTGNRLTLLVDLNQLDRLSGLGRLIKNQPKLILLKPNETLVIDLRFKLPVLRRK